MKNTTKITKKQLASLITVSRLSGFNRWHYKLNGAACKQIGLTEDQYNAAFEAVVNTSGYGKKSDILDAVYAAIANA